MAAALLERDEELRAIGDVLAAANAGAGRLVLVEGPAGVGKSSLLTSCEAQARAQAMAVLAVRGDELVMESSFAAMRELFWPLVRARGVQCLEGAARLAAPVFEGLPEAPAERDRASVVLHGLYWLVADLAEREPLMLSIDDAQWLDVASARFVVYLARRLEALPVLLVAAVRRGEQTGRRDLGAELAALSERVLRPAPLSEQASVTVVRELLGPRADDELCRSCHEVTRGNPFYLRALAAALRAERSRPTAELAQHVRELGAAAITGSVLVRLARLGEDCELLARSLAVLGPGSPLRHVAALASLDRDRASDAAGALQAGDLLAVGPELSFVHPLVHEAVSAELSPARRAAMHLDAARLLAADGASGDRVAAHLLIAEPYGERWVVETLLKSGREALARGAPEAAVSYLRRALAEPPAADARLQVLLELGRAEALLPEAHDFDTLREALALAREPRRRAEIALELALALFGVLRNHDARVVVDAALEEADALDEEIVERLDQLLIGGGLDDLGEAPRVLARAEAYYARSRRGELTDPRTLSALANAGVGTVLSAAEAADLARRALSDPRLLHEWIDDGYVSAAFALCGADELEEATEVVQRGLTEAQRRGSAPMCLQLSLVRSHAALRMGDLDVAQDFAERGLELGRELGAEHAALMFLAPIALERRRFDDAAAIAERIEVTGQSLNGSVALAERGRVRVACGNLVQGLADLIDASSAMAAVGFDLSVECDWVPAAAVALCGLARPDDARRLAHAELERAGAFGAPRRRGIALSVCGTLDDGPGGLSRLRDAVAVLERSPARLERARALVNLGAGLRLRGEREAARDPLARGLDLADRCGAAAVAERARSELLASGARPRRAALRGPRALTPAELRAARMAAEGLTNRQIAQALFVSTKTVEGQLSQAFAKLGVRRRVELADALKQDLAGAG